MLGSKSRSSFRVIFGMRFCSLSCLWRGFGAASARLRRGLGAGPGAADAPRAAPFSRAEGSYKSLYIARIANTRCDTQWARGPANFGLTLASFWNDLDVQKI